jgi:hypothetical protein
MLEISLNIRFIKVASFNITILDCINPIYSHIYALSGFWGLTFEKPMIECNLNIWEETVTMYLSTILISIFLVLLLVLIENGRSIPVEVV